VGTRQRIRGAESTLRWARNVVVVNVDGLASRWGITLSEPFAQGGSSVVYRCVWTDGTPAVVKVCPDRELLAAQTGMLAMFAPSGRVPAVLAVDEEAVVLEEVLPGTMAEDRQNAALPGQWGDLLAALHGVRPDRPVEPLRERMEESFDRIGRRLSEPAVGAVIGAATWDRAWQRCAELLDTETKTVLLHGDLHLGNALDGGRGLIAVDPKARLGDPCFDAVDYVVAGAGQEGVEARCEVVAAACGLDGDRLFAWSRVVAPMVVIAQARGGEPVSEELLALAR